MYKGKNLQSICSRKHLQTVPESLSNIINLAQLAIQENDQETAVEVFCFRKHKGICSYWFRRIPI
jgi:hypothetical protein